MRYLIGIDIGTSGTKSGLFDTSGNAICSSTEEYPLYQPQNGWAEQNPLDWWHAVCSTLRQITRGIDPAEVAGIGLSGQMHGLVMLDGEGAVLRPAILWCDGRTAEECIQITDKVGRERLIEITANPALPGFTASKIQWVKNHEPAVYERCRHILLPKDYIRYRLTGEFAAEVSDASGMQLLDVKNRRWSSEVLEKLEIDPALLGRMYESPEATGTVTKAAAEATGLRAGAVVAGGAGDNAAAAVGTGVVEDGMAFTTIGTSGVVYAHTSEMVMDLKGRVHTFCCAVPGQWHVMGVTQAAGLSLKWFRDNFCQSECAAAAQLGIDPYVLTDQEAARSPIGCNRLLYLPYLMGERTPHLDPAARGVFFGLSAMHQKRDMIRAIMEGVCYSLRDCLEILKEMQVEVSEMAACGGGGKSPLWRQMLADVFRCQVNTLVSREGPALGAAILGGTAAGVYRSVQEGCRAVIARDSSLPFHSQNAAEYDRFYQIYQSLYPALKPIYNQLKL